jgi:hypothetical protein
MVSGVKLDLMRFIAWPSSWRRPPPGPVCVRVCVLVCVLVCVCVCVCVCLCVCEQRKG